MAAKSGPPWMKEKDMPMKGGKMKGTCAKCGSKSHATAACKKK